MSELSSIGWLLEFLAELHALPPPFFVAAFFGALALLLPILLIITIIRMPTDE